MNARLFSIAILMSALPLQGIAADREVSLNHADFIAAEKVSPSGETVLNVKLSKSGKAKIKKLNASSVSKEIHVEVAGIASDFKLKVPIAGDEMQMGPYSAAEATKVVDEINKK